MQQATAAPILVSVLFPSRHRLRSARESVASLRDNASDPAGVEYLIAVDPDEPDDYASLAAGDVLVWTAPERWGYLRLHDYYQALARQARGTWLLIWNDDARMLSPGWDTVIKRQQPGVLWFHVNQAEAGNIFPCWPRAWTDAIGHIALCWNVDTWIHDVGVLLGKVVRVPVDVLHDRYDVTGGHDDQTAAEGSKIAYGPNWVYDRPEYVTQRERDAQAVRELTAH
jgi:hypothetical protein